MLVLIANEKLFPLIAPRQIHIEVAKRFVCEFINGLLALMLQADLWRDFVTDLNWNLDLVRGPRRFRLNYYLFNLRLNVILHKLAKLIPHLLVYLLIGLRKVSFHANSRRNHLGIVF